MSAPELNLGIRVLTYLLYDGRAAVLRLNMSPNPLLHRKLCAVAALAALAVILLACTTPEPEPLVITPAPTATPEPIPSPTPAPSPTPEPAEAPAPTSTPDVTPTPDTESVGHYVRAYAHLSREEYRQAEQRFTLVIELEPDFARGWDGRGQAKMLQGEHTEAMLDYDQAIFLKPNLWQAYGHRAISRMNTGDTEGARRDAEMAARGDPELVEPYIVLGRTNSALGDLEAAEASFTHAIDLAPDEAATYWWRGRFYRDYAQEPLLALADINRALEIETARAVIYLDRAILLMRYGGPEEDIRADLDEAISLSQDPRLPDVIDLAEEMIQVLDERAEAEESSDQ